MGWVKKITNQYGTIGIWEINETVNELRQISELSDEDALHFSTFVAERRKKEFLATRLIVKKLLKKSFQIKHENCGRPYILNSDLKLSISHSGEFVVVILSDYKVGIDIENTSRNISRVASRFLSETEKKQISTSQNPNLTTFIYWSAKEAIFKCFRQQNIQFNSQILIHNFRITNKGKFTGSLLYNQQTFNYSLFYSFLKNNVLVYCVEQ